VLVASVAIEAPDEGAVDLELVDGQLVQVGPRRVPGAEVVDGEVDAQPLEVGQRGGALRGRAHERGLGDLEAELARREARIGEHAAHGVGEAFVAQLVHGDVDRDAQRVACGRPRRGLLARPVRTKCPIALSCPLASAIGMNSIGGTRPRSGCGRRPLPTTYGDDRTSAGREPFGRSAAQTR
jgi:hypothetical protein